MINDIYYWKNMFYLIICIKYFDILGISWKIVGCYLDSYNLIPYSFKRWPPVLQKNIRTISGYNSYLVPTLP